MNVEKYCKFKKKTVVLNEANLMCICAHCENSECISHTPGNSRACTPCQEYLAARANAEYRAEKEKQCRICGELCRDYFETR